ncbi:hypothetical protein Pmani_002955 [Petrolisthes manimaculis]|uniref:Uncharacterized protein n=1 Tax=Petrolisthes manimaculis TaxID=1843537 RepID=A0AAE1QHB4_9EUCA|nr:hypothetical protein Pmani_002955 [Petrolisthes manimaculis]
MVEAIPEILDGWSVPRKMDGFEELLEFLDVMKMMDDEDDHKDEEKTDQDHQTDCALLQGDIWMVTWLGNDLSLGLEDPSTEPSLHVPVSIDEDEEQPTPAVIDVEKGYETAPRIVDELCQTPAVTEVKRTQFPKPATSHVLILYQTCASKPVSKLHKMPTPGDVIRPGQSLAPTEVKRKHQAPTIKSSNGMCHTPAAPEEALEICHKSVTRNVERNYQTIADKDIVVVSPQKFAVSREADSNKSQSIGNVQYHKSAVIELQKYHKSAVIEVEKQLSADENVYEHQVVVIRDSEKHMKPAAIEHVEKTDKSSIKKKNYEHRSPAKKFDSAQKSPVKDTENPQKSPVKNKTNLQDSSLRKVEYEQISPANNIGNPQKTSIQSVAIQTSPAKDVEGHLNIPTRDVKVFWPKPKSVVITNTDDKPRSKPAAKGVDPLRQKPVVMLEDIFFQHRSQPKLVGRLA